jgi:cathepsin D
VNLLGRTRIDGVCVYSFNLGSAGSNGQCVGALAGQDLGLGNSVWLLGDSFMKNVYTAFSFDQSAVGFATLT